MFIESPTLPDQTQIEADICVVGAGAAGITLGKELTGSSLKVVLLESGGFEFEKETQALYEGESVGEPYDLYDTRARFFGGSTNWWAGWCRPLDPDDFAVRDWVANSGWPIELRDIQPYYKRATEVCGIAMDDFDFADWRRRLNIPSRSVLCDGSQRLDTHVSPNNPHRRRFGEQYRQHIGNAGNVTCYLHANVVAMHTDDTAREVKTVQVRCLDGPEFSVKARYFVLASGGIENARLLLLSNRTQTQGLGNRHGLVGRFFMDHLRLPSLPIRFLAPGRPSRLYDSMYGLKTWQSVATLCPNDSVRKQYRIGKYKSYVNAAFLGEDNPGFEALMRQYRRAQFGGPCNGNMADFAKIVRHLPFVSVAAVGHYFHPDWMIRKYNLRGIIEQTPNADSRVTLSAAKDRLGCNKVRIDWRFTELDRRTSYLGQKIVAEELEAGGIAKVRDGVLGDGGDWSPEMKWTWHHMGTTRMHENEKHGVVDPDCRVHGMSNLYIAGSSVFPTGGNDLPTLTIVALTLRLTDHLKSLG
jgi:choline dehydrogenase-like flavoprotein